MYEILKPFPYSTNGLDLIRVVEGDRVDNLPPEMIEPFTESGHIKKTAKKGLRIGGRDIAESETLVPLSVAPAIGNKDEGIAVFDGADRLIGVTGTVRDREGLAVLDDQNLVVGATGPVFSAAGEGMAITDEQDRVLGPVVSIVADPAPEIPGMVPGPGDTEPVVPSGTLPEGVESTATVEGPVEGGVMDADAAKEENKDETDEKVLVKKSKGNAPENK